LRDEVAARPNGGEGLDPSRGSPQGAPYKADAVPLRTTRADLHTTTVISMDAGGLGVA